MTTALAAALTKIDELASPDDWVVAATIRGLMLGYDHRWELEQKAIRVTGVEVCFQAPLTNIDTSRTSRTFKTAGKLDKLAEVDGKVWIVDHKTTSSDISDPTGYYWRQLAIDSQPSHYELLLLSNGIRVDQILWDVVRKPAISPKIITKADHASTLAAGTYCNFTMSPGTLEYLLSNQRENGEMFAARVAQESLADPDKYFARRSVPRTRESLYEYATELWQVAADIRESRRTGCHYRNSGACFNYNRPCPFLNLCAGSDTPDSDRWRKKAAKNPELPEWIGNADVLTNSRLRTFQTCRRLHYYKYELGIERSDDGREEALYFGSLWGEVLDTWWSFNQEASDGSCN